MSIYGKDFAATYNDEWAWFGPRIWPFLSKAVAKRTPNATAWLDLCCGTGSLLKLVCDAGFRAVGLDGSRHQLRHARRNAPAARLVHSDVRSYRLAEDFDVITCMFDSLNYLTAKRDLERAFRCARRHLAEGGVFIFDVNTFEGLQDNWCRTSAIRDPERLTVSETSFDQGRARGRCLITGFVKEGRLWRRFDEEHVQRGYRASEVDGVLGRAGFAFAEYDGSTLGRPKKRSGRLIYVCERR
ncbi:MAG: class I SAM-dependent DNA methyltransferase [Planctomycetota bacterium]|jgi:SAM-dependent methyltransferase